MVRVEPGGPLRRASATMAATPGTPLPAPASGWRGRGKAKCAGGQGTWWEGSGQLGSKPLGAEAWERAH